MAFNPIGSQPAQPTQPSLKELMLAFAEQKTLEKQVENMTETGDYILVKTLLEIVDEDDYYKVREIKEKMAEKFDEEQKWLKTEWVGRALKRLGFTDKRRVGTGVEYRLNRKDVIDLAERMGITIKEEEVAQREETKPGYCWVCGRLLPSDLKNCTVLDGKYVHLECYHKAVEGLHRYG